MTTSMPTRLLLPVACSHGEVLTDLNRLAEAVRGKARLERTNKAFGG